MIDTAKAVRNAWQAGLVVPAFNIPYLPMVEPIVRAIMDTDCFALVAVARIEWTKLQAQGLQPVYETFKTYEKPTFVRLHLDHVPVIDEDNQHVDYLTILRDAVRIGYQSVMVDGSRLSLAKNIAATRRAAEIAHGAGVPLEAELGAVFGHEAGPMPPYEELFASGKGFTDPDEAARFVRESGCDWLSVAFGSFHGAVSGAAKDKKKLAARLNIDHLKRLRDAAGIPLVLHGGSGVQRSFVQEAIKNGIAKVNVGADVRLAYEQSMAEFKSVPIAQEAVYERTCEILRDDFLLQGTRKKVTSAA